MDAADAEDVLGWRRLDRELQDLDDGPRRQAQTVVDIAEAARDAAHRHGTDPVDDLLDTYQAMTRFGSRALVSSAIAYLRVERTATISPVPGTARPTRA